jgi:hypothetical protein
MTSRKVWWLVAAVALGAAGYFYLARRDESYGMKPLPGGRVTAGLFPAPRSATVPPRAPVAPAHRGDNKTVPPTGLRIVEPESSRAPEPKP